MLVNPRNLFQIFQIFVDEVIIIYSNNKFISASSSFQYLDNYMVGSAKIKQHSLFESPIFDDELAVTPLTQNWEFYYIVLVIIYMFFPLQ